MYHVPSDQDSGSRLNFPSALKTPGTRVIPLQLTEDGRKVPHRIVGAGTDARFHGVEWSEAADTWVAGGGLMGIMLDASGLIAFDAESAMKHVDPGKSVSFADLQADDGSQLIDQLFRDAGIDPLDTLQMRTLNNGTHRIYRQNPECRVERRALKLQAYEERLDVIVGFKNYLASGGTYRVVNDVEPAVLPVEVARYLNGLQRAKKVTAGTSRGLQGGGQDGSEYSNPDVPTLLESGIPAETAWTHEEILRDVIWKLIVMDGVQADEAIRVALQIGNESLLRPWDPWRASDLQGKVPGALRAREQRIAREAADLEFWNRLGVMPGHSVFPVEVPTVSLVENAPDQGFCTVEPKPAPWFTNPPKARFFEDDTEEQAARRRARGKLPLTKYDKAMRKLGDEDKFRDAHGLWNWTKNWTPSDDWKTAPEGCWQFYSRVVNTWITDGVVTREFAEYHDEHGVFLRWLTSAAHPLLGCRNGSLEPLDDTDYPKDRRTREERLGWMFDCPMKSGKNWTDGDQRRGKNLVKALIEKDQLRKKSARPTHEELARQVNIAEYKRFKKLGLADDQRMRCVNADTISYWLKQMTADLEVHVAEKRVRSRRGHRFYCTAAVYHLGVDPYGPDGVVAIWAEEAATAKQKAYKPSRAVPITAAAGGSHLTAPTIPWEN